MTTMKTWASGIWLFNFNTKFHPTLVWWNLGITQKFPSPGTLIWYIQKWMEIVAALRDNILIHSEQLVDRSWKNYFSLKHKPMVPITFWTHLASWGKLIQFPTHVAVAPIFPHRMGTCIIANSQTWKPRALPNGDEKVHHTPEGDTNKLLVFLHMII